MKKKMGFFLGAALLACMLSTSCSQSTDKDEVKSGTESGVLPNYEVIDLSAGGIAGDMQGWDDKTAQWNLITSDNRRYEYEFVAEKSEHKWKVLSRKTWDAIHYGIPAGENTKVSVGGSAVTLAKDLLGKTGDCVTDNLVIGHKYKITVIVKEGKVKAMVSLIEAGTPTPPTPSEEEVLEEGLYIGLLSFDSKTHELTDKFVKLDKSGTGKYKLKSILDTEYKPATKDGTVLYYAVHKALNKLKSQEATFPKKTQSCNIITFTDGLDVGSTNPALWSEPIDGKDFGGEDGKEYLEWLHGRLEEVKVKGQPVTASAYGVQGKDIEGTEDITKFKNDIEQLKTANGKAVTKDSFDELGDEFGKIAKDLTIVTKHTSFDLLIIPPTSGNGTVYKMTFDNIGTSSSNADNSAVYFTGTYNYDKSTKTYTLKDIQYTGITCSQTSITGEEKDGVVKFHFDNFNLNSGTIIKDYIQQWYKAKDATTWRRNSEYEQGNTTTTKVDKHSAIIYLVLDSSKSLSSSDVYKVRNAAKDFIDTLQTQYYTDN